MECVREGHDRRVLQQFDEGLSRRVSQRCGVDEGLRN